MEQLWKRYKYLFVSAIIRIYLLNTLADECTYLSSVYKVNSVFFHLVMGIGVTLFDILFLLDAWLYIYHIKDQIIIRLHHNKYYLYISGIILLSYLILMIQQCVLQYVWYNHMTYHFVVYSFVLIISNLIIFRFDNDKIHNYLIILSLFVNMFFKLLLSW